MLPGTGRNIRPGRSTRALRHRIRPEAFLYRCLLQIRFIQQLAIDKGLPVDDLHRLPRKPDKEMILKQYRSGEDEIKYLLGWKDLQRMYDQAFDKSRPTARVK